MSEIEVTVESFLPSHEPQGQFNLRVSPETTVEDFMKELCKKAGTSLKSEYILRNKDLATLYRTDTLHLSKVRHGAVLQWERDGLEVKRSSGCCNIFFFLAVLSFLLGTVGIVTVCIIRFNDSTPEQDYAVVFDAGSSHSSMFIYKWEASRLNGTAVAGQYGEECEAEGDGISQFLNDPQKAGKSLQSCIDKAIATIPSNKHATTPIYLGATAGMRLLRKLNLTASEAILNSVRETFLNSPFKVQDPLVNVRILDGSDEGACSWITSNYITNAFKVNRPEVQGQPAYLIVPTLGAIDMGGASTQITFIPANGTIMPANFTQNLQLFGQNYTVYTYSYLCYGVNEIVRQISARLVLDKSGQGQIDHPCLPTDYSHTLTYGQIFNSACVTEIPATQADVYTFVGTGQYDQCSTILQQLFDNTTCPYSSCSFNKVYQPVVSGPFYAFSSFYYVSNFLNLLNNTDHLEHRDFEEATKNLCKTSWNELKNLPVPRKVKENLMNYCLQATYINLLISTGYNFTDELWKGISFVLKIYNTVIGWTLGYVLRESNGYPTIFPEMTITTLTFALLMALFCLLLLLSLILTIELKRARSTLSKQQADHSQYGKI